MSEFGTVSIKESPNSDCCFSPREITNNNKYTNSDHPSSPWNRTPERVFNTSNNDLKKKTVRFKVPEIEPQYQMFSPQGPKVMPQDQNSRGKTVDVLHDSGVFRGTRIQTGVKPRRSYSLQTRIDE